MFYYSGRVCEIYLDAIDIDEVVKIIKATKFDDLSEFSVHYLDRVIRCENYKSVAHTVGVFLTEKEAFEDCISVDFKNLAQDIDDGYYTFAVKLGFLDNVKMNYAPNEVNGYEINLPRIDSSCFVSWIAGVNTSGKNSKKKFVENNFKGDVAINYYVFEKTGNEIKPLVILSSGEDPFIQKGVDVLEKNLPNAIAALSHKKGCQGR